MHDARSTTEPSTTPIAIAPPVESPAAAATIAEKIVAGVGGGDKTGGGGGADGGADAWTLAVTGACAMLAMGTPRALDRV